MTKIDLLNNQLERNYQLRKIALAQARLFVPEGCEVSVDDSTGILRTIGSAPPVWIESSIWATLCSEAAYLQMLIKEVT